jgi:hypothetical protein
MKKLLQVASLSLLAAGCMSGRSDSSLGYGYFVTNDGYDGCAFRYGYYPYYDAYASGPLNAARMEIVRIDRPRVPHLIDRGGPWPNTASGDGTYSTAYQQSDRSTVTTAPPPPPTRVVEPRS